MGMIFSIINTPPFVSLSFIILSLEGFSDNYIIYHHLLFCIFLQINHSFFPTSTQLIM